MKRTMQKTSDSKYQRRLNAILLLAEGHSISAVSRLLHAARSSIQDWKARFERWGEAGLCRSHGDGNRIR